MPRIGRWDRVGRLVALVLAIGSVGVAASADDLRLLGGGSLQGEAVPIEGRPGFVEIYTASSDRPYVFRADRVEAVSTDDGPLDAYLRRRGTIAETAEAQHAFGLWCEERGLTGPAEVHYRRAVELDDGHGPSHEKLGHVEFDGRWMTYDELRAAQGLVKFDGRWVTPEEKGELADRARAAEARTSWARRIKQILGAYRDGTPAGRAEALDLLRRINDPDAVIPLVDLLGQMEPSLRMLMVEILADVDDPIAASGLAHQIVREPDDQIRLLALNELARRGDPDVVDRLVEALDESDPDRVGRAAWALAGLGAVEAVPKLIPELVSRQRRVETVYVTEPTGGGMGLNASFGTFGGGGPTIPVLTGPAVAPGTIAFGVQAVPVYQYNGQGPGISYGAYGAAPRPVTVPRQVVRSFAYQNVEVLAALERLTGQNFGYDLEAWRRWLRAEFRPPAPAGRPARSVPQP